MSNYVFLDTQVFIQNHFSIENKNFSTLIEHLESGDTILVSSKILSLEIKKHIKSEVTSAINNIKKHPILRLIKSPNVTFDSIWQGNREIKNNFSDQIFTMLDSKLLSYAECIGLEYASAESVFDDYFEGLSPFLSGKPEFPDAFVANSLLHWAKQKNCKISIVSGNTKDWEAICRREEYKESFVFYKDLSSFLSSISGILEEEKSCIRRNIIDSFSHVFIEEFKNMDIELDSDLQVWDEFDYPELEPSSIEIEISEINITSYVSADDEAEADVQGIVRFSSYIDCSDPDSGVYDSEEKEIMFYTERLKGKVEAQRNFSCLITIRKNEIIACEIDEPRKIELTWGGIDDYSHNDNFIPDPYEYGEED